MFELLGVAQVFGIFPCSPVKGYFKAKPVLVAVNAGIICFLIIIHYILLTKTNDKFQKNVLIFLSDNVFLGVSCIASHIILLSKRNALCGIINQIISLRNSLPIQLRESRFSIINLFVLGLVFGFIGSSCLIYVDGNLWTQIVIFNSIFFYNSLINIVFLVIISEHCLNLHSYNGCLKKIGLTFVYNRNFFLKCQLLVKEINQQFSVLNILKVINSLIQCVVSVNYVKDSPAEFTLTTIFCMFLWSSGYVLEIIAIIHVSGNYKDKVKNFSL